MNLRQLEVFLAVAEAGSFSRGAEASLLTQSTVSQHISALEQELGIRLLDRTGKGVLLTAGGELLAEHARRIMNATNEVASAVKRFKGVEDVHLRVGGSNIPGNYMIPQALPALRSRFPRLRITVSQGDSRDILQRLREGEVEVGVVGDTFGDRDVEATLLGEERIILVVPRGHRWCDRSVELNELAKEPLLLREVGSGTGKAVSDSLLGVGIDPAGIAVVAVFGSNEGLKQAVAAGTGVSFLSTLSVRGELERGELVEVPVEGLDIRRHFYLAAPAGREPSPAAGAFSQVMLQMYGTPR